MILVKRNFFKEKHYQNYKIFFDIFFSLLKFW